jgi:hypothetical protein
MCVAWEYPFFSRNGFLHTPIAVMTTRIGKNILFGGYFLPDKKMFYENLLVSFSTADDADLLRI